MSATLNTSIYHYLYVLVHLPTTVKTNELALNSLINSIKIAQTTATVDKNIPLLLVDRLYKSRLRSIHFINLYEQPPPYFTHHTNHCSNLK